MEAITEQEIDCLIKKGSIIFIKRNKVYDVSEFANQMKHPGGREVLTEHVGKDVASVMKGATHSHSQNAYKLMEGFCIGQLVKEEDETQEKELPPQNEEIESLVDWNKAMVWQVQKLGEKYENWIHSPVDRPMRIFQTTAMELLTMTPWYMVLVIWVPVMTLFMQMSLRKWGNDIISFEVIGDHKVFIPDRSFSLVFLLGLLLWTLIEYCLHRFLFHLVPPSSSPTLMRIHFLLHGIHHKIPCDGYRLVFPPALGVIFFSVIYYIVSSIVQPVHLTYALVSGALFGFIMYDVQHYFLHHSNPRSKVMRKIKAYHSNHHFVQHSRGYGVSIFGRIWDVVFNTGFDDVDTKLE